MAWGLFEIAENVWIGDDSGPKVYDDFLIARICAQVVETQMYGTDLGCRIEAREINTNNLRKRDEVSLKMDSLTAIRRVEGE